MNNINMHIMGEKYSSLVKRCNHIQVRFETSTNMIIWIINELDQDTERFKCHSKPETQLKGSQK